MESIQKLFKKKIFRAIIGIVLIAIPIFLIILPSDYFDNGNSICLSVVFFDTKCYGCGLTRGVMHLIHFDFEGAANFNKLTFAVFPLLVMIWLKLFLQQFGVKILKWF